MLEAQDRAYVQVTVLLRASAADRLDDVAAVAAVAAACALRLLYHVRKITFITTIKDLPVSAVVLSPSAMCRRLDIDGNDGLFSSSLGGDGGDCGDRLWY